jgi:glucokinase
MVAARPVVLGLDYGGTKIAAAVSDLAGNRLASTTVGSDAALGAQASFGRGIEVCRDLLSATAPGRELIAVGVSTFGIPFEDRVELAPAIDAKAAARAEVRWGVLAGCDPAVYLNLGTGLAVAIVVGGQVVDGVNGAAGEIGYNLRAMADVGLPLDQRAQLEHMVSGQALAERAADQGGGLGEGGTGRRAGGGSQLLTAADVFAASAADSGLDGLIADFTRELAFHLVNLAILVNPARIAVGGGIVRSWARIRTPLQHALRTGTPFPPELVVAHFPYDAPLLGAVAMAVDAATTGAASEDTMAQQIINTGTLS